jgi:WD40 repeat protein
MSLHNTWPHCSTLRQLYISISISYTRASALPAGLVWSPHDPNLIATSSADFRLAVWNLATEQCVHSTFDVGTVPLQLDWCRHDPNLLVALCDTGRVVRWRLTYPRTVDRIDVGACECGGEDVSVGAEGCSWVWCFCLDMKSREMTEQIFMNRNVFNILFLIEKFLFISCLFFTPVILISWLSCA